jgi:hypothetical protein
LAIHTSASIKSSIGSRRFRMAVMLAHAPQSRNRSNIISITFAQFSRGRGPQSFAWRPWRHSGYRFLL